MKKTIILMLKKLLLLLSIVVSWGLKKTPSPLPHHGPPRLIVSALNHAHLDAYLIMRLSLLLVSNTRLQFIVLNDGSLTTTDKQLLQYLNVKVKSPKNVSQWQDLKFTVIKTLFPSRSIILVDSDVIFYRNPHDLFSLKTEAAYMKDCFSRYSLSQVEIEHYFGVTPLPKVNVGIVKINTRFIPKDLFAKVHTVINKVDLSRNVETRFIEQTCYSILFSQFKKKQQPLLALPDTYFLYPRALYSQEKNPPNVTCLHYTSWSEVKRIKDSYTLLASLVTKRFSK